MADEQIELRRINWGECFGFTHLFKSFRLAIHPSKMVLALAAVLLILGLGLAMDLVWSLAGQYAAVKETTSLIQGDGFDEITTGVTANSAAFERTKRNWQDSRHDTAKDVCLAVIRDRNAYTRYFQMLGARETQRGSAAFTTLLSEKIHSGSAAPPSGNEEEIARLPWQDILRQAAGELEKQEETLRTAIKAVKDEGISKDKLEAMKDDDAREAAKADFRRGHAAALAAVTDWKLDFEKADARIRGVGVCKAFFSYETDCISKALSAAWRGNIFSGMQYIDQIMEGQRVSKVIDGGNQVPLPPFNANDPSCGVVFWGLMAVSGFKWLFSQHIIFALVFTLVGLAIWAVLAGAIHRIAALHAAREEKISMVQALKFSVGKFFGFYTAPLIPVAFVFLLGLLIMISSALGNIPAVGEILIGVTSILSVILGLVIAFVLVGLVGGLGLMYPTIAVEGSDSFDAISRSFNYIFARPWRAGFYGIVTTVYGGVCYVFVRLFALAALLATHFFLGLVLFTGGQSIGGASKLDTMWTAPSFSSLHGPFNWVAMTGPEKVGAGFLWASTGLIAAAVFAFVISFACSGSTMIYYLLRRKVDATDLDDVYVEEPEQPLAAAPTAPAAPEVPPAPQG